jgi:hypothetical protein
LTGIVTALTLARNRPAAATGSRQPPPLRCSDASGTAGEEDVRQAFAHRAAVDLDPAGDEGAPGAAVTVELCGHWAHEPPCPVAAHHTAVVRRDDRLDLRILFATEPEREAEVRARIERALRTGALRGPDGRVSTWRLRGAAATGIAPDEAEHARRLALP